MVQQYKKLYVKFLQMALHHIVLLLYNNHKISLVYSLNHVDIRLKCAARFVGTGAKYVV